MGLEAALAVTAAAGAFSATTQIKGANMQARNIERQAEYNAQVYEQQAEMIQQKKKIEDYQYNRAIAKMRGSTVASAAGRGLLLGGSPLAVLIDNETQMRFDQAIGNYNLDVERNYALSGANYYRTTGKEQSKLAKFQGYSNAFSTILNTGASVGYMNYYGARPA